jgi:hypothetical protein
MSSLLENRCSAAANGIAIPPGVATAANARSIGSFIAGGGRKSTTVPSSKVAVGLKNFGLITALEDVDGKGCSGREPVLDAVSDGGIFVLATALVAIDVRERSLGILRPLTTLSVFGSGGRVSSRVASHHHVPKATARTVAAMTAAFHVPPRGAAETFAARPAPPWAALFGEAALLPLRPSFTLTGTIPRTLHCAKHSARLVASTASSRKAPSALRYVTVNVMRHSCSISYQINLFRRHVPPFRSLVFKVFKVFNVLKVFNIT